MIRIISFRECFKFIYLNGHAEKFLVCANPIYYLRLRRKRGKITESFVSIKIKHLVGREPLN